MAVVVTPRRVGLTDLVVAIAALVLAAVLVPSAAAGSGASQPYPVLVEQPGLRVYAPGLGEPWGRCPRGARALGTSDLRSAGRVALVGVTRLYARDTSTPRIDVRGASARAARLGTSVWTRAGLARTTCSAQIARRTIAVGVRFPRVNWSASLSSATFFVSRVGDGWIIWHRAH